MAAQDPRKESQLNARKESHLSGTVMGLCCLLFLCLFFFYQPSGKNQAASAFRNDWTENRLVYNCPEIGIQGNGSEEIALIEEKYAAGYRVFRLTFTPGKRDSLPVAQKNVLSMLTRKKDLYFIIGWDPDENADAGTDMKRATALYPAVYSHLSNRAEQALDRVIPEVYSERIYNFLMSFHRWKALAASWTHLDRKDLNPEAELKLVKDKGISVIILPPKVEDDLLDSYLTSQDMTIFVQSENDTESAKKMCTLGVRGFFTDTIGADALKGEPDFPESPLAPLSTEKPEYSFHYGWTENRFIVHALGGIDGRDYANTLEGLKENYDAGARLFEVDLRYTSDGRLVCIHGWDNETLKEHFGLERKASEDGTPLSYEEFKAQKVFGSYTPASFEEVAEFLAEHPDIYLVIDGKTGKNGTEEEVAAEYRDILDIMQRLAPGMEDKLIPQIYFQDMLEWIMEVYPWKSVIYTWYNLSSTDFSPLEEAEFAVKSGIRVIVMDEKRENDLLNRYLTENGLILYVHTINDPETVTELQERKVHGVFSDFLRS